MIIFSIFIILFKIVKCLIINDNFICIYVPEIETYINTIKSLFMRLKDDNNFFSFFFSTLCLIFIILSWRNDKIAFVSLSYSACLGQEIGRCFARARLEDKRYAKRLFFFVRTLASPPVHSSETTPCCSSIIPYNNT